MKKEFVPYEIAKELKDLGFNEPCICGYDSDRKLRGKLAHSSNNDERVKIDWDKHDEHLPAPLWQQAFRWFIEKHQLNGVPYYNFNEKWDYNIQLVEGGLFSGSVTAYIAMRDTYEEIQLACMVRLIEKVKEKK